MGLLWFLLQLKQLHVLEYYHNYLMANNNHRFSIVNFMQSKMRELEVTLESLSSQSGPNNIVVQIIGLERRTHVKRIKQKGATSLNTLVLLYLSRRQGKFMASHNK